MTRHTKDPQPPLWFGEFPNGTIAAFLIIDVDSREKGDTEMATW
jgi:hypothetical protein